MLSTGQSLSLTAGDPAMRRSYSLPTRDGEETIRRILDDNETGGAANNSTSTDSCNLNPGSASRITYNRLGQQQHLRHSKSEDIQQRHKLDRYGFIINMDSHGNLQDLSHSNQRNGKHHHDDDHGTSSRNEKGATAAQESGSPRRDNRRHNKKNSNSKTNSDSRINHPTRGDEEERSLGEEVPSAQIQRRIKKWGIMLSKWNSVKKSKLVKKRLRKGIPDEQRGIVWPVLCAIDEKIQQHQGLYKQLVEQSVGGNHNRKNGSTTTGSSSSNQQSGKENRVASPTSNIEAQIGNPNETASAEHQEKVPRRANGEPITFQYSKSFKVIQDTIERDIHRTFPRHSMFYKSDNDDDNYGENDADSSDAEETDAGGTFASFNDENSAIFQTSNLCGDTTDRLRHMMLLPRTETSRSVTSLSAAAAAAASLTRETSNTSHYLIPTGNANGDTFDPARIFDGAGGQARLRRVLKAYSTYDREIGYCQGMNFIAAMFLTLMPEERAFWMLVSVMYDEPCRMRGLFAEGMRETHKVLFVAEKLIHQFLPRLAKHLDKETIHVTMYATQWLLTQYTSSFKFDLVTRVWDCFLFEGWKITYRVMLSILQRCQPILLAMSFEEMLGFFRDLSERPEINASVIDDAIKIPLKTSHIVKYENQWRVQQEQLEQQQQQGTAGSS